MFQSLLWWNVLLNLVCSLTPSAHIDVSILVVVECPSESWRTWLEENGIEFQSLLWWNVLLNEFSLKIVGLDPILFQSLLWWNVLLNGLKFICSSICPLFQSLLWWNVLLNDKATRHSEHQCDVSILVVVECPSEFHLQTATIPSPYHCFNPCCGGMSF